MAYATTNPPVRTNAGALTEVNSARGVGGNIWLYASADADATVSGAGYFSNAAALGLQVGDIVIVQVGSPITDTYLHIVTAINATTGAATLSSTTVPHIN